jgi:hypothetical protein
LMLRPPSPEHNGRQAVMVAAKGMFSGEDETWTSMA